MKHWLRTLALLALSARALAGGYVGDYAPGDTVDCNFTTFRPSTGATFTLGGTPAISAYKDNSTTQSTSGVTLSADFDGVTGLNHVRVTTASDGTFYSAGSFIELVITTGTVDSVSVTGSVVCSFSLTKVSALRPTTPARTLDVSSGGEAGVDWANVGSPTTTVNLSGTTIATSQSVVVGSVSAGAINAAAIANGAIDEATYASDTGPRFGILTSGTAQSGSTGTTLVLASSTDFTADNRIRGATCAITAGTGAGESLTVASYVNSTDTATMSGTWPTTPDNTSTYLCWRTAPVASSGSGATAQEVWEYGDRQLTALDEDVTTLDLNATATGAAASVTASVTVGTNNDKTGYALSAGGVDAIWDEATSGHATAGTYGVAVTDILQDTSTTIDDLVDDLETRVGTPSNLGSGATLAANNVDIEGQTDDIGAAGAGLTAADDATLAAIANVESGISWNSAWDAEVQSEVNDALVANLLDQLLLNTYDPATPPGAADSLLEDLIENDAGVARFTTNALENGPAGGGGSADWSAGEREQIRHRLGVDGTAAAPSATPSLATAAALQVVDDLVDDLETRVGTPSNLGSGATLAANNVDIEGQTDDIGAAGAGLTAADDAALAAIATRASQTSVDDIPTNAELTTALGTADDAVLAAIAALNNLSPNDIRDLVIEDQGSQVRLGCALAALVAYAGGDVVTSGATSTYEDPSGTETRITGTVASPGNRTATITCPTY